MKANQDVSWNPAAAFAAWLLPGLGHWVLGEKRRAVILLSFIGGLWLIGLLVGGVGAVNRTRNGPWFLGQMLTAPSVLVELGHYSGTFKEKVDLSDNRAMTYEPPFGRPAEQGILYTALAGMLNLLAIIDVVYREPRRLTPATAATEGDSS